MPTTKLKDFLNEHQVVNLDGHFALAVVPANRKVDLERLVHPRLVDM